MIKVRIPASSANLGPGFDCFGIAWQLYNEMSFEKSDRLEITGCAERHRSKNNLAYRALCRTLSEAGMEPQNLKIDFGMTGIPVSRGLGSSAALIGGAVTAANELFELGFTKDKLFEIATEIEGHPDNIAPALFGGLTVSAMDGKRPVTADYKVHESLHFTCIIPDKELSTSLARSVLPGSYSREDAIFNVSHAALLMRALIDGDIDLLGFAMQDRIHEPYRFSLIEGSDKARQIAVDCGAKAFSISGAGSTMLAVGSRPEQTELMTAAIAEAFPAWQVKHMIPDTQGTVIL